MRLVAIVILASVGVVLSMFMIYGPKEEVQGISGSAPKSGSAPEAGLSWVVPELKMALVPIRHGMYFMGSAPNEVGREERESMHEVVISKDFWIGRYEVTQAEYAALMERSSDAKMGEKKPVTNVTWADAITLCEVLTGRESALKRLPEGYQYRLPTEAEWEYCCRAGSQTAYCFGDDIEDLCEYAWFRDNS
jgi:formylglycine-generating enzyme required for sulfatase activity